MMRVTFVVTNVELVIVHIARFLQPLREETSGRRRGNSFRFGDQAKPSRVSKIISVKPQIEPVQDAYWKKDSTSYQEAP